MTTNTATTETQYGIQYPSGNITWPDADGEIYFSNGGYIPAVGPESEEGLLATLAAPGEQRTLVRRIVATGPTRAVTPPAPPVPTLPTEHGVYTTSPDYPELSPLYIRDAEGWSVIWTYGERDRRTEERMLVGTAGKTLVKLEAAK
jgi:hypothetical protein